MDVIEAKAVVSEDELVSRIAELDKVKGLPLNLFDRIMNDTNDITLAAEFKRASPSKGEFIYFTTILCPLFHEKNKKEETK